jgi:hypothetical protein
MAVPAREPVWQGPVLRCSCLSTYCSTSFPLLYSLKLLLHHIGHIFPAKDVRNIIQYMWATLPGRLLAVPYSSYRRGAQPQTLDKLMSAPVPARSIIQYATFPTMYLMLPCPLVYIFLSTCPSWFPPPPSTPSLLELNPYNLKLQP